MKWESIVFGIVVLVVGVALALAYFALVDAYRGRLRKGELDRAIADLDEAIRLDPKKANFYRNRTFVYDVQGEGDRGEDDYDEASRLDPKIDDNEPMLLGSNDEAIPLEPTRSR